MGLAISATLDVVVRSDADRFAVVQANCKRIACTKELFGGRSRASGLTATGCLNEVQEGLCNGHT